MVVAGRGQLECDGRRVSAAPGCVLAVPCGTVHRASASDEDLVIVEVQRGSQLREDDIERLQDDYNRVPARW